jgi:hypothetical protein
MNVRERFLAVCRFERPDRPFRFETMGFWDETITRWHGEGLPQWVAHSVIGFPYFKLESWLPVIAGDHNSIGFFPPFMPKIIRIEKNTRIVMDTGGKTYREFRDGSSSIPQHIDDPVHNMDDFRKLRWRLNPDFPGRADNPLVDATIAAARIANLPLAVSICGLFGGQRHLLGVERLMLAYFDQPELLHAIARAWIRMYKGIIRRIAKKTKIDLVTFWEDMCFKNGPLISPRLFKKFMTPYYKELIDSMKEEGVGNFWVDTDGDCTLLIPLFEEAGVTGMYPFEVQAGMDVREVRKKHPKLVILGGIDKRALAKDRAAIEEEVMSRVPPMLEIGGYFPCTDHAVPPDVPLENFKYYLELMRSRF